MIRSLCNMNDISAAAERIRRFTVRTPLLESDSVNELLGVRVLIKPECLQKTGSFKARGALNFAMQLPTGQSGTFVGFSSGNHAQGLAYAARLTGKKAHVLMPGDAPKKKVARTRELGASVELLADFFNEREPRIAELCRCGGVFIPPFDHEHIVAGQGTVGLEIADDLSAADVAPAACFIPASGGGLLAGSALAIRDRFPDCHIIGVEPAGFDDFSRSIQAGSRVSSTRQTSTICDGLMSPMPGAIPFAIARELGPSFKTVDEQGVTSAVGFLFSHFNLVTEPSGAAAFAALVANLPAHRGSTVVVVVSGGNVDTEIFAKILLEDRALEISNERKERNDAV